MEKIEKYFVTDYFGGKTYASNGIALIRKDPKKPRNKEVVIIASDCGGPGFIVERWSFDLFKDLCHNAPRLDNLSDKIWNLAQERSESLCLPRCARKDLEKLLGKKLVERIHRDPLFD